MDNENRLEDDRMQALLHKELGQPVSEFLANHIAAPGENQSGAGINAAWLRSRGSITRPDARTIVGRVGAPPRQEATSSRFHFWIPEDALVEATQIVTAESTLAGQPVTFYALVEEVHRCSRRRDMGHEVDEFDGDLSDEPIFAPEGFTYADAAILRAEPDLLTPPRERSPVLLAGADDAAKAYGMDEIAPDNRLAVGLVKNGGAATAGPGCLDLDFLLGGNGGHLNVGGAAGRATKSSFLLTVVYTLLAHARRLQLEKPNSDVRPRVVPIIFNVKNFDLFYLDQPNVKWNEAKHASSWRAIGIDDPQPFQNVTYFAPQQPGNNYPIPTGRTGGGVRAYSWSLRDIIENGLLTYLFSEEDAANDNFMAMLLEIEDLLTHVAVESDGSETRTLRPQINGYDNPITTFENLRDWLSEGEGVGLGRDHVAATRKKLSRRLMRLLYESRGVLRLTEERGSPLDVVHADTCDPLVVDLNGLVGLPALQRFVVAAVLRQVVDARTGSRAQRGLRYLIVLDELNRFAPKNARDPITKLIEMVAAEMRSQGVILFGAQQQASLVSSRVIENASIKALGQTGRMELSTDVWRSLSEATRRRAEGLRVDEKLLLQPGFRHPMHLRVPHPAWAMTREEADLTNSSTNSGSERNGSASSSEDLSGFGDI